MTLLQYQKWSDEIKNQSDLIISTQQYQRFCNVFIQDVWLDCRIMPDLNGIKQKAEIMFSLQEHFIK